MATQTNTSAAPKVPDYEVFQIMDIEGRDKGKFYETGVAYINTKAGDGSINLMTVHGKLQLRPVKPR